MPKAPKNRSGRKPGKSVRIVLSFTREQLTLIDRASSKEDDNRANWIRRRSLADARAVLGIAPEEK